MLLCVKGEAVWLCASKEHFICVKTVNLLIIHLTLHGKKYFLIRNYDVKDKRKDYQTRILKDKTVNFFEM